jgi:hypothetical protein
MIVSIHMPRHGGRLRDLLYGGPNPRADDLSTSVTRGNWVGYYLFFIALLPVCVVAEGLRRLFMAATSNPESALQFSRSMFAEAREAAQIAISYVFTA